MSRIVSAFLAVSFFCLMAFSVPAYGAPQNIADTNSHDIDANGIAEGVNFTADGTLNVTAGSNVNTNKLASGAVTNVIYTGTINFAGDSTIAGEIGSLLALKLLTVNAGTVTATGTVINAAALNFAGDGKFVAASGATLTVANVSATTSGQGALEFAGDGTVNGDIGILGGRVLKLITINAGTVTATGGVAATTVNFAGDGQLRISDGKNLTANVTNTTTNEGTLTLLGASTVTGNVGSTGAGLKLVTVGNGTCTIDGDIKATKVNFAADNELHIGAGHNVTTAFDNTTDGQGTLTFLGASTMTGNIGTATTHDLKAVNIGDGVTAGGIVTMAGDIAATTTTIDSGGTLKFTANRTDTGNLRVIDTMGAGSGGTLDLGSATLTLTGTYTQATAGTTIRTTILSDTSYGNIAETGNATVNAGNLDIVVSGYVTNNTVFTIIDGGGGVGVDASALTITDNSAVLTFTGVGAGTEDLQVTATRTNTYTNIATDANASAAGSQLEAAGAAGATGDMATVLNTMDELSSAQISSALDTVVPQVDGGVMAVSYDALSNFVGLSAERVENIFMASSEIEKDKTGVSTGDEKKLYGWWGKGFGGYLEQDTRKGISGYNAWNAGTAMGIDARALEDFVLGFAGGWAYGKVDSKSNNAETTIDSAQATLYGGYEGVNYPFFIDASGSFAWNWYQGTRDITVGGINRTANADYDGQQYDAYIGGGYRFKIVENFEITPLASLEYCHLRLASYTETEAGALSLSVGSQSYDFLQSGIGGRMAYTAKCDWGSITPEVHGKWFYEYIGDKMQLSSTFTGGGGAFDTNGFKPDQNSYNVGGMLIFRSKNDISLVGQYDLELKDKYWGQFGSLTLRYEF